MNKIWILVLASLAILAEFTMAHPRFFNKSADRLRPEKEIQSRNFFDYMQRRLRWQRRMESIFNDSGDYFNQFE